ncbi:MAG: hypothetical protein ACI83W_000576 [Marinoscillum sp.]|jgi:hypothetical protein
MKLKIAIIALIVIGFSACTQKTCPTYATVDQPTEEVAKV